MIHSWPSSMNRGQRDLIVPQPVDMRLGARAEPAHADGASGPVGDLEQPGRQRKAQAFRWRGEFGSGLICRRARDVSAAASSEPPGAHL